MHIITSLTRQLQKGNVLDPEGKVLQPSVFADLYRPSTIRIVSSLEFAQTATQPMPDFENDPDALHHLNRVRNGKLWIEHGSVTSVTNDKDHWPFALWFPSPYIDDTRLVVVGNRVLSWRLGDLKDKDFVNSATEKALYEMYYAAAILYLNDTLPPSMAAESVPMGIPKSLRGEVEEGQKPIFTFAYLRNHRTEKSGEYSAEDHAGRRWHYVRRHTMTPQGHIEPVWRKAHWRGDPKLGVVRRVLVGST